MGSGIMSDNKSPLSGETPVMLTMRQLIGGIIGAVALGSAALWGILQFTVGGLRDDVSAIRTDLGNVRTLAEGIGPKLSETQLSLTRDIDGMRNDMTTFQGELKGIGVSIGDMKEKVDILYKTSTQKQ
jgi:hypothetical protein